MWKPSYAIYLILIIAGSFLAGTWYSKHAAVTNPATGGRHILYYHDPMHPAYKSDKPGIAPDCGMQLEPVYADGAPAAESAENGSSTLPPGTVRVSPERQQVIGVRLGQVERTSGKQTLRTVGRVTPDENRIYRIVTGTDGWIRDIFGGTSGSVVERDQLLCTLYNRDFLTAEQGLIYALNSLDRFKKEGMASPEQVASSNNQIRAAEDNLHALGMGELQIEEITHTRKLTREIAVRAPTTGLVLARNVFPGLRFDRSTELYRLVDLSSVWILADVFQNEAGYFQPGVSARVSLSQYGKSFDARASSVPPVFDPSSRTLKVRLEARNPQFLLRPDMFVDVELPVTLPPTPTVPVDAVLDSGLKKTVFAAVGEGIFEPRKVETGWRFGDRVQILKGLMEGERIVVSGTFMLDSESRLKAAAAGIYGESIKDPVCGMDIDEAKAKAVGRKSDYRGTTYYFCSDLCKGKFDRDPEEYSGQRSAASGQKSGAGGRGPGVRTPRADSQLKMAKDLACGMDVDITAPGVIRAEYQGTIYYFCSPKCRDDFMKEPAKYLKQEVSSEPESQANGAAPQTRTDVSTNSGARPTGRAKKRGQAPNVQ